jgi:hypothetical protein
VTPRLSQGTRVTANLPVTLKVSQAQHAPLLGSNIHTRQQKTVKNEYINQYYYHSLNKTHE